jgi:flagellar motor protein MotB
MSLSLRTSILGTIGTALLLSAGCAPGETANPWTLRRENAQLKSALRQYQDQLAQAKTRADNLDAENENLQTHVAEEMEARRRAEESGRYAQNSRRPAASNYDPDSEAGADIGAGGGRSGGGRVASSAGRNSGSVPNIQGAQVLNDGNAVRVRVTNTTLFDSGKAALKPEGKKVLDQVASSIRRSYPNQLIGIEGHTDSDPIHKSGWKDNHDLSYQRARAVYDYLSGKGGIPANQLYISAYGPNNPVASNSSQGGKAQNRRVEFVVRPDESTARQ